MIDKKIQEIKATLTHSQFKLAMSMYKEDVEFHKNYRNNSQQELCDILGQAANIAIRF